MAGNLKLGSQHEKHMWMRLSFFEWLTFSWVIQFIQFFKTQKGKEGVPPPISLHERESAGPAHEGFQQIWARELMAAFNDKREASLMRALFQAYGTRFLLLGIWKVLHSFCIWFAAYYLLRSLIMFTSAVAITPSAVGYGYALGIFIAAIGQTYCLNQMQSGAASVGIAAKAALSSIVYRKMMRLKGTEGVGEVVNIIARECDRVIDGCLYFHYFWAALPEIIVICAMVGAEIGVWVLPGVAILVVVFPVQLILGYMTNKRQEELGKVVSERVTMMGGILDAVKIVKYNAWELFFAKVIRGLRTIEMSYLNSITMIRTINFVISFCTPMLVALACFGSYYINSGVVVIAPLTSFTILSIANSLRYPLFLLPTSTKAVTGAVVAVRSIGQYLQMPEVTGASKLDELSYAVTQIGAVPDATEQSESYIKLTNATFSWGASLKAEIQDVNVDIKGIHLMAVVGPLASGKSSLMAGLTKQISMLQGSLEMKGRTAYVSQQPWLYNATLRDNILFGLPMDEDRYNEVVRVCALQRDLELLPNGDLTEIAERGTNLSGGQRQRVNLARAVYSDYEIILLDDPLSAVDQKVGRHIFQECVKGFLSNKLIVFVTHQMQYLDQCDSVLVLNGVQVDYGKYSDLMQRCKLLQDMVGHGGAHEEEHDDDEEPAYVPTPEELAAAQKAAMEKVKRFEGAPMASRARLMSIVRPMPVIVKDKTMDGLKNPYLEYMSLYGGKLGWLLIVVIFATTYCIRMTSDAWITFWTKNSFTQSNGFYVAIYGVFVFGMFVWLFARGFFFSKSSNNTAEIMHDRAMMRVMRGTMLFFYRTPLARLVSIFSADQERIDDLMPDSLFQVLQYVPLLLATLILIAINLAWTAFPAAALLFVTFFIARATNDAISAIKKQEAISRPHALTHVTATTQGLQTIRAMNVEKRFVETFEGRLDRSQNFWNCLFHAQLWQAMQLDLLTAVYVFIVCCLCVFFSSQPLSVTAITPSLMGLVMSCAMQAVVFVGWSTRAFSETRDRFSSVQTSAYYASETPQEAEFEVPEHKPPQEWPQHASIEYRNAILHYNPDADPVLRNVNFKILHKEKIGIVGRTGAGKSTLLNSLLRMFELTTGNIQIDGLDIRNMGLHDLRVKIAVIPQEPVLFAGTLRSNLDPFNKMPDDKLWDALKRVHLFDYASNQQRKLEAPVAEYGLNLSMGQRQLLCIARVLLTDAKILVMDEATASIDMVTDSLIQETVRTSFQDCTVLTIAHRLRTVIDYDRIMVMDAGSILEFDAPAVLLRNPEGALSAFVAQTGVATATYLHSVADAAYRRRRRIAGLTGSVVSATGSFSINKEASPVISPISALRGAEVRVLTDSPVARESSPLIRRDRLEDNETPSPAPGDSLRPTDVTIDIPEEKKE